MSGKCHHHESKCHHHEGKWRKYSRPLLAAILILLIILLVFLIFWAVQPHKPRFVLQDATIFNFNVSAPNMLSVAMQVTIHSRNPNDKIGVYYDRADIFATYRGQQITSYTAITPVYQGHKDVNIWSPFLCGINVPIAPFYGVALTQDQCNGAVRLTVKMSGRIKWKVGTWVFGHYHLHVSCPAYIPFGNRNTGIVIGTGVKYQLSQSCRASW